MKKKGLGASLKNLVLYDEVDKALIEQAAELKLTLRSYNDVLTEGERASDKEFPLRESHPSDVYIFSYTSGTTGDSKVSNLHTET